MEKYLFKVNNVGIVAISQDITLLSLFFIVDFNALNLFSVKHKASSTTLMFLTL